MFKNFFVIIPNIIIQTCCLPRKDSEIGEFITQGKANKLIKIKSDKNIFDVNFKERYN